MKKLILLSIGLSLLMYSCSDSNNLPSDNTNLKVETYIMFFNHTFMPDTFSYSDYIKIINTDDSKLRTAFSLLHNKYDNYEGGIEEFKILLNDPDKELLVNSESRLVNNGDAKVDVYRMQNRIYNPALPFTDFMKLISDNPDSQLLNDCYKDFINTGYNRSKEDFKILLGISN